MNDSLTHIILLVDQSGSMLSCQKTINSALSEFIDEQKKLPGDVDVTLVYFASGVETIIRSASLATVGEVKILPSGMTKLYDAIVGTGQDVGRIFASRPESKRPGKVLCVIVTDGMDTASLRTRYDAFQFVTEQQKKWNWQFLFIGANQDAVLSAAQLGIEESHALSFNSYSPQAVNSVGRTMSRYAGETRVYGSSVVRSADRTEAMASAIAAVNPQ